LPQGLEGSEEQLALGRSFDGHLVSGIEEASLYQLACEVMEGFDCGSTAQGQVSLMQLGICFLNQGSPEEILVLAFGKHGNGLVVSVLQARYPIIYDHVDALPLLSESKDVESIFLEFMKCTSVKTIQLCEDLWLDGSHAQRIEKPLVLHLSLEYPLAVHPLLRCNRTGLLQALQALQLRRFHEPNELMVRCDLLWPIPRHLLQLILHQQHLVLGQIPWTIY